MLGNSPRCGQDGTATLKTGLWSTPPLHHLAMEMCRYSHITSVKNSADPRERYARLQLPAPGEDGFLSSQDGVKMVWGGKTRQDGRQDDPKTGPRFRSVKALVSDVLTKGLTKAISQHGQQRDDGAFCAAETMLYRHACLCCGDWACSAASH